MAVNDMDQNASIFCHPPEDGFHFESNTVPDIFNYFLREENCHRWLAHHLESSRTRAGFCQAALCQRLLLKPQVSPGFHDFQNCRNEHKIKNKICQNYSRLSDPNASHDIINLFILHASNVSKAIIESNSMCRLW